jgi:uncharacterized protein YndB with AHSA1/START domain
MAAKEATIVRTFDAPTELVWHAIVDPEQLAKWFGHDGITTTAEIDARPGGTFAATMVNDADGSEVASFFGHYREVEEPSRIVHTLENAERPDDPDIEILTYTLRETGGGTELTYHQVGHLPDEQYALIVQGVNGFYDRLALLLAEADG